MLMIEVARDEILSAIYELSTISRDAADTLRNPMAEPFDFPHPKTEDLEILAEAAFAGVTCRTQLKCSAIRPRH